jgi:succinylglutamate desuccinylase
MGVQGWQKGYNLQHLYAGVLEIKPAPPVQNIICDVHRNEVTAIVLQLTLRPK